MGRAVRRLDELEIFRMSLRAPSVGSVLLFAVLLSPSIPESASAQVPAGVDLRVHEVTTGGLWNQGYRYGNYRVLVFGGSSDTVRSQIFVQWLERDDQRDTVTVAQTAPIRELNTARWIVVDDLAFVRDGPPNRVRISFFERGRPGQQRVVLVLGEPGEYRLVIASP